MDEKWVPWTFTFESRVTSHFSPPKNDKTQRASLTFPWLPRAALEQDEPEIAIQSINNGRRRCRGRIGLNSASSEVVGGGQGLLLPHITHTVAKPPRADDLLLGVKLHRFTPLNV